MIKIFMPAPNESWIGDITTHEFKQRTKHTIVDEPRDADLIYLYSKWIWNHFSFGLLVSRPCIMTVHHIVPEKQNKSDFIRYDTFVDRYHVPNTKTEQQLKTYTRKPITILPYWINQEKWFSKDELEIDLLPKTDKVIVASFQRDTEGSSIGDGLKPMPKLEKGPDIFVEIVRKFKADQIIPFVPGWRRDFIVDQLKNDYNIITDGKLPDEIMNTMYNMLKKHNGTYLVTSRYEGGPQAIIEAAQTKTKILSTDVGIATEILHNDCICYNVQEFFEKLKPGAIDHTIQYNYEKVQQFTIDKIIPIYDDFLESMI